MKVGNIGRIGAFFIACALAFPAAAAILYTNANETPLNTGASNPVDSGTIKRLDDSCVLQDPQSYTHSDTQHVRRVTAPVRAGTYAQVQIVQKGCDYRSSNPDLRQKPRVGMVPKKTVIDAHSTTAGKRERWVSFSFYLSTDFQFETNTLNPDNLFQNFKEGSRSYGASNFDVTLKGTTLELQARNASANGQTGDTHVITGITRGQWYDITLHYNLQEPGGSGGFFAWYINYPGYATPSTPIFSNSDVGTTVNTETGAGQHSYAINLYKYAGYCTSAYQLNAVQCPYSTATGYPAATTNATNWTGQRKIYFDEFRIGDSTSSLAEIAPHVYGGGGPVDPPPTGVQIIGMNAGQPIEPSDDPVYFTATGGSVVGCLQVDITDQIGTKVTMPKCNTNATGGRYTADALTTLIGGPITVDLLYDVPLFDTATMTNTMDTWSGTNTATAATHTNGSELLD
ncbi:MAG: heparin lyase I family protein, partial [Candidatus Promineifilaceae bacterium]